MGLSHTVSKDRKIYGNWKVYSPEGLLMFRCGEKKAKWYLNRDLAEIIDCDNLEIKLTFVPKGLGNHSKDYGTDLMENICVNCGSREFLTRHHVVPYCYRKFFPLELKSHQSHDIVSMCVKCHEEYEEKSFLLKIDISKKYDAPINGQVVDNVKLIKIIKLASCLTSEVANEIPKKRIDEIKNQIRDYFKWKRITKKRLNDLSNKEIIHYTKTHGELVVEKIENINQFNKMWRNHFLENNDLRHLPKNWSVDYE